jgi:Mn2+/Fe2+ NRAMP family transporter
VITAAFIGPGTVTTCAAAGARHRFDLLWALLFSTCACLVLQEAAGRLAIVSGLDLGGAIRTRFRGGAARLVALLLVFGGVIVGCAAYEAGNILGALSGAALGLPIAPAICTLLIGGAAALLLWFGSTGAVARLMGIVVALMGAAFLGVALRIAPGPADLLAGALLPSWPAASGLLVLGLIGTTVVPYNLFLGSALARGHKLADVRLGLGVAIPLGGIISMGILVVGTAVDGPFDFTALAAVLAARLGGWAAPFFAFGLFAAGFTSAITAPLAAALTARSLFATEKSGEWDESSWRYRSIWGAVLLSGIAFGLSGVKPIPAILVAQALNGVLLPFVGIFLLLVLNDRSLMGEAGLNGLFANTAMGTVVGVTLLLGLWRGLGAAAAALGLPPPAPSTLLLLAGVVSTACAVPLVRAARRRRLGVEH